VVLPEIWQGLPIWIHFSAAGAIPSPAVQACRGTIATPVGLRVGHGRQGDALACGETSLVLLALQAGLLQPGRALGAMDSQRTAGAALAVAHASNAATPCKRVELRNGLAEELARRKKGVVLPRGRQRLRPAGRGSAASAGGAEVELHCGGARVGPVAHGAKVVVLQILGQRVLTANASCLGCQGQWGMWMCGTQLVRPSFGLPRFRTSPGCISNRIMSHTVSSERGGLQVFDNFGGPPHH